ncbi:MAG: hypothetical protein OSA99_20855 [Acidimicrobiales bacterium]|nr:hypothetical protein [Acidimicrobiales bacterium]
MGDVRAGGVVDFDFEGSLILARRMWALADDLLAKNGSRSVAAATASREWRGSFGDEFSDRRAIESESYRNVRSGLIDGANAWAQAWATAMDQQNLNNRAAQIESDADRISDERGRLQKGVDFFNGDDSWDRAVAQNPEPGPYPVPRGPGFHETEADRNY